MRKNYKKKPIELDSDERELFLNAFFQGEIPKNDKEVSRLGPEDEQELFLRAFEQDIPKFLKKKRPLDSLKNKAHKKRMTDAIIDLHGMRAEEAISALRQFLQDQIKRGSKKVLVIHGKGSGVLRNAVYTFIEQHPQVDDFQVAIGKMGGEGALLLRINQRVRR